MTDDPTRAEILFLLGTLAAAVILLYGGRAVAMYRMSLFTARLGGFAVILGGSEAEAARQVVDSAVRRQPLLRERALAYSGTAVLCVYILDLQTGLISRRLADN